MEKALLPGSESFGVCLNATAYDSLAWLYHRYWRELPVKLMPALDQLVLSRLPRGARVLDLCCGTGHLTAALCRRGFLVTALDGSAQMAAFARQEAPAAEVLLGDARSFRLTEPVDAIVSTGDSLNHMTEPGDLQAVLRCCLAALAPGGFLLFDMNLAEAFETQWHKSSTVIEPDHILHVRGRYDRKMKLGSTEIVFLRKQEQWVRTDIHMTERCYARRDVLALLREVGFAKVAVHAAKSLGVRGRLAVGRAFFQACKAGEAGLHREAARAHRDIPRQ